MRIVYTGAFDEVEAPYLENGQQRWVKARPGEPVECPDELAERLLEQSDTWGRAESPTRPARKTNLNTATE